MEYILALATLAIGFLLAWFLGNKKQAEQRTSFDAAEKQLIAARTEAEKQTSVLQESLRNKQDELQRLQQDLAQCQHKLPSRNSKGKHPNSTFPLTPSLCDHTFPIPSLRGFLLAYCLWSYGPIALRQYGPMVPFLA